MTAPTTVTAWLDAKQALVDAATDGPWSANLDAADLPWVMSPHFEDIDDVVVVADSTSTPDARFIADARTTEPALIAALRLVQDIAAKDIARQPDDWADDIALTVTLDARAAAARDYLAAIATALGVSEQ